MVLIIATNWPHDSTLTARDPYYYGVYADEENIVGLSKGFELSPTVKIQS